MDWVMQSDRTVGAVSQREIVDFMCDPDTYLPRPDRVEHIETHGAHVFLAGDSVFKIKRAVTYPYLDYGTLEKRRAMCVREFDINQAHAPEIYRRVVPITEEAPGQLKIGGRGPVVEWALEMARFEEEALLSRIAARSPVPDELCDALAMAIDRFHHALPPVPFVDSNRMFRGLIEDLARAFKREKTLTRADAGAFERLALDALMQCRHCLDLRAERGFVRRCHGDLHAGNVVVLNGRPVLFDALEFDDSLATIDLLYDIAFLLMDLMRFGRRRAANRVLNRYLYRFDDASTLYGLQALPLFLSCRAAVRAMVAGNRRDAGAGDDGSAAEIAQYFGMVLACLRPVPAGLIAVGGFSGTGKTTLAASLAPRLGKAPGAIHLRTDIERKLLLQVDEAHRLPAQIYTKKNSERVYDIVFRKAAVALKVGHSVIVDAVFSDPAERKAVEQVARNAGVPFFGIWLTAPLDAMRARVADREGDASDATPDVVDGQVARGTGPIAWSLVECGGTPEDVAEDVMRQLQQSDFPKETLIADVD
jgi:aminoglycoside phosphotransferase family enzyme/predicted kinase